MSKISDQQNKFQFSFRSFLPLLSFFLFLRLLFLLNFPIFNDEANSIQWTQFISNDWDIYKFISVNNVYATWRPPLTFWLAVVPIRLIDNPLLAVRLVSVSASAIGLISIYAFAGYYFGSRRIALWAGVLWTLNPMTVLYDREFVTETFVYSFSAAAYLFTYLTISKHKGYVVPAVLSGLLAILSKQSGQLYLYGLIFFAALQVQIQKLPGKKSSRARLKINHTNIVYIFLIIALSYALYRLIIPSEYFKDFSAFNNQFMLTPSEIMHFPFGEWMGNVKRIYSLFSHYYSVFSLVLIAVFVYRCATRQDKRDLLMLAWFAFNSFIMVVYFKYYNEYMYNTSNILFLTLILGAASGHLQEEGERITIKPLRLLLRYGGVSLLLVFIWAHQLAYYYASPVKYIEKFGTPWMQENYLNGWPSGFGIDEAIALLKQERSKYLLIDPQWGNPGVAIEIYAKYFPSLRIIPISADVLNSLDKLNPKTAIALFRYRPNRGFDDYLLAHKICSDNIRLKINNDQAPLIYCKN